TPGACIRFSLHRSAMLRRVPSGPIARAIEPRFGGARVPAAPAAPGLVRDGLHLAERGEPPERLDLDLAHTLARQAEPAADLLERLRLVVGQAVAQDEHLPLALAERRERRRERLAAERELHLL